MRNCRNASETNNQLGLLLCLQKKLLGTTVNNDGVNKCDKEWRSETLLLKNNKIELIDVRKWTLAK